MSRRSRASDASGANPTFARFFAAGECATHVGKLAAHAPLIVPERLLGGPLRRNGKDELHRGQRPSSRALRACRKARMRDLDPWNFAHPIRVAQDNAFQRRQQMKAFTNVSALALSAGVLLASHGAFAQGAGHAEVLSSVPTGVTVTDWYKQSVYDPSDAKIGEVKDVLVSQDGKINALVVGVGGFLGAGEKDVAVPFGAIKHTEKNSKVYLTMDTTKDALKSAPGFKYDKNTTKWVPDKK
jgi:sporulation protein YlmC with PRC-barrel domain